MHTQRFISENTLAEITGTNPATLKLDRYAGRGFPYYRIGGAVRYDIDEVLKIIESNRVETRPVKWRCKPKKGSAAQKEVGNE